MRRSTDLDYVLPVPLLLSTVLSENERTRSTNCLRTTRLSSLRHSDPSGSRAFGQTPSMAMIRGSASVARTLCRSGHAWSHRAPSIDGARMLRHLPAAAMDARAGFADNGVAG